MPKARTTINISIPLALSRFVQKRMKKKGFENTSEYFRHLVREDQRRAKDEGLEALLLEGLTSGEPQEVTDEWWEDLHREVAAATRKRKSA